MNDLIQSVVALDPRDEEARAEILDEIDRRYAHT
jgi:orotidine-5'-phosphate decarboxylase